MRSPIWIGVVVVWVGIIGVRVPISSRNKTRSVIAGGWVKPGCRIGDRLKRARRSISCRRDRRRWIVGHRWGRSRGDCGRRWNPGGRTPRDRCGTRGSRNVIGYRPQGQAANHGENYDYCFHSFRTGWWDVFRSPITETVEALMIFLIFVSYVFCPLFDS
jgi:hypothetical protein